MASLVLDYVTGSGFTPLISGNPWSGRQEPIGGLQIRADSRNSGLVYVSLSGAFVFSGQASLLVGSGGPTITSGAMFLSGGISSGCCDGMPLSPGDAYFVPKISFPVSGTWNICAGADLATSGGFARLYLEMY